MQPIKCVCGNKGCTTHLKISTQTNFVDIILEWKNRAGNDEQQTIMLDPNSIVQLIQQLKTALTEFD